MNVHERSAGTIVDSRASVAYRRTWEKKKEKSGGRDLENFATIRSASSPSILNHSRFHFQVIDALLFPSFKLEKFFSNNYNRPVEHNPWSLLNNPLFHEWTYTWLSRGSVGRGLDLQSELEKSIEAPLTMADRLNQASCTSILRADLN